MKNLMTEFDAAEFNDDMYFVNADDGIETFNNAEDSKTEDFEVTGIGFRNFLNYVGAQALLTADEEIDLAKRIEAGDMSAKKEFIEHNLRLVVSIANKFKGIGPDIEDLISDGQFGLINAVDNFDYRKGNRFSTFATACIRNSILNALNQDKAISLSNDVNKKIGLINNMEKKLTAEYGCAPTYEELSDALGMTLEELVNIKATAAGVLSLDSPFGEDDEDAVLADFVPDGAGSLEDVYFEEIRNSRLSEIMEETLSEREIQILKLRVGMIDGREYSTDEVGSMMGLSGEAVRKIEHLALKKLRRPAYTENLHDFGM